jgi:hypothetical protein
VTSYSSGTLNRESAGALGAGAPSAKASVLLGAASLVHASSAGSNITAMRRVVANVGSCSTD